MNLRFLFLSAAFLFASSHQQIHADEKPSSGSAPPGKEAVRAVGALRIETPKPHEPNPLTQEGIPNPVTIQCVIVELRGDVGRALKEAGFRESPSGHRYSAPRDGTDPQDESDQQQVTRLKTLLQKLGAHAEVNILSRPQIRALIGQQAMVHIGSHQSSIPYLVQTSDKTFSLRELDVSKIPLGLTVEMTPREVEAADQIEIAPLRISMTTLDGRESIEGVELDVGKPIIATRSLETTITMKAGDEISGIALPGPPGRQPVLFLTPRRLKWNDPYLNKPSEK